MVAIIRSGRALEQYQSPTTRPRLDQDVSDNLMPMAKELPSHTAGDSTEVRPRTRPIFAAIGRRDFDLDGYYRSLALYKRFFRRPRYPLPPVEQRGMFRRIQRFLDRHLTHSPPTLDQGIMSRNVVPQSPAEIRSEHLR